LSLLFSVKFHSLQIPPLVAVRLVALDVSYYSPLVISIGGIAPLGDQGVKVGLVPLFILGLEIQRLSQY
jgi:Na+/phosphate symporter